MYIIHLGYSGFPYGNATIQRIRLTFNALRIAGFIPLIINKNSYHQIPGEKHVNRFQSSIYINTSFSVHRHSNFLLRNLNKISGFLGELWFLISRRKKIQAAIFYQSSFSELVYYRLISRLLGFSLIVQFVELRSAIPDRSSLPMKINDRFFDDHSFRFCDGMIVISEFLRERARAKKPGLPLLKIPAICDFNDFEFNRGTEHKHYLMYCGSILYSPVIEFVIELYAELRKSELYDGSLLLVIGGHNQDHELFENIRARISSYGQEKNVTLLRNIPYKELVSYYQASELLIVPMRNTIQDIAGFHHKVGEYSATGRPIISTQIGELSHYFADGQSAILAEEYSIESYVQKLKQYLGNNELLTQIGKEGFKVGITSLNYSRYAEPLKAFIKTLSERRN